MLSMDNNSSIEIYKTVDGHFDIKVKIEDETIEQQVKKLMETKEENTESGSQVNPQKDLITYDDFMKMDLRSWG